MGEQVASHKKNDFICILESLELFADFKLSTSE